MANYFAFTKFSASPTQLHFYLKSSASVDLDNVIQRCREVFGTVFGTNEIIE